MRFAQPSFRTLRRSKPLPQHAYPFLKIRFTFPARPWHFHAQCTGTLPALIPLCGQVFHLTLQPRAVFGQAVHPALQPVLALGQAIGLLTVQDVL